MSAWFRRTALAAACLAGAASIAACPGEVPAGGACHSSGECKNGLQCLYPLGSGCSAAGQCDVPTTDCGGSAAGLVLCACSGALDLACIPASATLTVPTGTGADCSGDAGDAGDAADAADAG
jgi:hypothetical protein